MSKESFHQVHTNWASTNGTANLLYDRTHIVSINDKQSLQLTTANPLRGDSSKWNPEDLLVAAVSSCHMLSYLYLCAKEGIVVTGYQDIAAGTLTEVGPDKSVITGVVLQPEVTVAQEAMKARALELHHAAHEICIIANSVNFEVSCQASCKLQ